MSFRKLLSPDRKTFVEKTYNEMLINEGHLKQPGREFKKGIYLSLVKENEKLSKDEKEYCKERYIYEDELQKAIRKIGEPTECVHCREKRYSDRFCENCIRLQLQNLFGNWTSENQIVDKFIQKCQMTSSLPTQIMEWIPYDEFENVKDLTSGGFSTIYTATWTKGRIFDYDENVKEFIYFGTQKVVLKSLHGSNKIGEKFFKEVNINFII